MCRSTLIWKLKIVFSQTHGSCRKAFKDLPNIFVTCLLNPYDPWFALDPLDPSRGWPGPPRVILAVAQVAFSKQTWVTSAWMPMTNHRGSPREFLASPWQERNANFNSTILCRGAITSPCRLTKFMNRSPADNDISAWRGNLRLKS